MESINPPPNGSTPPSPFSLLTFLMKEKAATTFLRDARGHTQRSARNIKAHKNTNKIAGEGRGSKTLNKNINTATTMNTTIEQQKSGVPGPTAGARAV